MSAAKTGRNDRCPCGSGKKYKHCCLGVDADTDQVWRRLRIAEGKFVDGALTWASRELGPEILRSAWSDFSLDEQGGDLPVDDPEFGSGFMPYFAFNWRAARRDPREWPRRPPALELLRIRPQDFDAFDARFAAEACGCYPSFHQVVAVEPGKAIEVRDLLRGVTARVRERKASHTVAPGGILFARLLSMDGVSIFIGSGSLLLPPDEHLKILDLRDGLAGVGSSFTAEMLEKREIEVRDLYLGIRDAILNPRLPEIRNTDREPLQLTTLRFDLRCSPQEAFDSLKALAHGAADAGLLADAELDADGRLRKAQFSWSRKGNRIHAEWDNTTLGSITIEGSVLSVFVNSEKRARKVKKEVEKRLGERACFRAAVVENHEKMLEDARSRPETARERRAREENERLNALPEVREQLRSMAAKHWQGWFETRLPALRGLTPREAARRPDGRERLEALLRSFEWSSRNRDDPFLPDVARMRRELGL